MSSSIKYQIIFEKKALKDIKKISFSGRKSDKNRLENCLEELKVHPYSGSGKPEKLKFELSGLWSRRLNKKDRLIYEIIEKPYKKVVVISALGHYE
ncbi:Txe/YoeB family addiction module toxin [Flavobacteriaceae bacterium 14752]|uniref:Txe/YoeB family addiction module toxin n=1 Tax=Mesohalobacter salilacus TaxID=2491711 RepID=UPI000F6368F9|nr:Txe/YoeB family addiction module toxin [Flavobacteriaceae bacterium 14752]